MQSGSPGILVAVYLNSVSKVNIPTGTPFSGILQLKDSVRALETVIQNKTNIPAIHSSLHPIISCWSNTIEVILLERSYFYLKKNIWKSFKQVILLHEMGMRKDGEMGMRKDGEMWLSLCLMAEPQTKWLVHKLNQFVRFVVLQTPLKHTAVQ